jgi:hypothetical protein
MTFIKLVVPALALFLLNCNPQPTGVSLVDGKWHFNGSILNPGTPAEGLMINVRLVNATFEDSRDSTFNADQNCDNFIEVIPVYKSLGVNAITLNVQGGMPGYEGAVNSAFASEGSLKQHYFDRVERVIRECEANDMIVILGLFYQRQDQLLQDSSAVKQAVVNGINWITEKGFQNVLVELANEFPHGGFDHDLIRTDAGMAELIRLAKKTNPQLLVSASGLGNGTLSPRVIAASDFLLIHFNGTPVEEIPARINDLKKYDKAIVCNEDDKVGGEACAALLASIENNCSYGYMNKSVNQYKPFEFNGQQDDPEFYSCVSELLIK